MIFRAIGLLVLSASVAGPVMADDVIDGQIGPGSLYRLVRPTQWNGDLVLYAHGFVDAALPVALPQEADEIIGLLAPQGYAVAMSSFSENGWDIKDGIQRTHQLLGIFKSKFGAPNRVYIAGSSMGGLIAVSLAEDHPGWFAGALPACAAAGGTRAQFDYLSNTRALFDFFYPGVLPGNAANIPANIDLNTQIAAPAAAAMAQNPTGALAMSRVAQTPIPFQTPQELAQSIITALVSHASGFADIMSRTHNHPPFDNSKTIYTGTLDPLSLAAINAGIQRFKASPSALNFMEHNADPTGDLQIPMLMLSTSRDPVVPGLHQVIYASEVAAAGHSDLLVQRTVDTYGHCNFTPNDLAKAFSDLVLWVQFGVKPTP